MAAADSSSLPSHMRAQVLDAFNTPYALRTLPLPALSSPYDMLVRVEAASYCHTDAVLAAGQMHPPFPPSFPHIGCHEFAGTVVALPEPAELAAAQSQQWPAGADFRIGDRVGVPGRSFHPCGRCFECVRLTEDSPGYSVYCPHAGNKGIGEPGGFCEYAVVDRRQVAPLARNLSAVEAAPLMCAGLTVYAALKRCGLAPGDRVGIMGCGGGLGHLGLQFAAGMQLNVVGVDNADGPLQLARDIAHASGKTEGDGQILVVDARVQKAADVVAQLGRESGLEEGSGDAGLDAVVILPESQAALDYGIGLLRNHGKCVVVSFPQAGFHLSSRDLVFRDISVVGSLVGSNTMLREMLRFADEHNVRPTLAKTFPLSKLNDLVAEYHKGQGGKFVIDMVAPDGTN